MARQSLEPRVLAVEGAHATAVRRRPRVIRAGAWDDDGLRKRHGRKGETSLGEAEGVRTVDGRDVLHQGPAAGGVQRQSGGAVGQRANGHAGVDVG